ncbi:alpha/beta hydrolase [soil metagenome]
MLTSVLGGRAFAERHGSGTPRVVALHGWGRDRSDFNAVLAGTDALALDQPGFGATPDPETGWSTAEYADWLAAVLTELAATSGGLKPIVMGHSFGGRVAVQTGARRPELIGGLVLTGVPLYRIESSAKPALGYRLMRWAHTTGLLSDERMEAERRKRGSADYRNASGVMREVLVRAVSEDYSDQVAAITVPTRLVWGEGDTAAPIWMAEKAHATIADSELAVVPGAGHLIDDGLAQALRVAVEDLGGVA